MLFDQKSLDKWTPPIVQTETGSDISSLSFVEFSAVGYKGNFKLLNTFLVE